MEQARFSRSFFRRRYLRRKKKYIRLKKMDTHFRLACRGVFILLHEGPFSILEICVKNGSEKNYISVSSLLDGTHGFEEYVRNLHSISFFPEIQKVPFNVFPMVFLGASRPPAQILVLASVSGFGPQPLLAALENEKGEGDILALPAEFVLTQR